jgi:PAS domain S-box-containing protein
MSTPIASHQAPPGGRPLSPQAQAELDAARIGEEILGRDDGTDPFVAAVRATRMPMIITNPRLADNPVVFVNDAFCRLTGYARAEIIGRNCRFLQGPGTEPETVAEIRAAVRASRAIEIEICNHRKDGSTFWNRLLMAPVHDAAGELAYFFASQVDVTLERERLAGLETHNAALLAELTDRLRQQEDVDTRLRFATQAGRLGVWQLDLQTNVLTSSRIFRQNFGRDPAAPFSYEELLAAVHEDDRSAMNAAFRDSVTQGSDYQIEFRIQHPNGSLGWVEIRAQVERAADGSARYLAGVSMDISARKRAQSRIDALVVLDDRFRTLEDPAELAFAAAEILGRTLEVSRAGYGTVDLAAETITIERDWNAPGILSLAGQLRFRDFGTYIDDLKRGETVVIADAEQDPRTVATADALKSISAQAFINMPVTEQSGLVALLYLNHEAARTWSEDDQRFVHEVAQRTRMAVERRRAEQGLRALASSLESQVAERTAELMEAEAALRQSQKMEAVGQLTGGLAHDFNNLLTGVTGSLELMKMRLAQGRTAELERYVFAAEGAARRAASLTHRLLAFSRRQTLQPKSVDVNALVAGMEDLVRQTVGPAIKVEAIGSAGLWKTLADPSQLENALLNLCINARDAMPDGGRLTIETANKWVDARVAALRDLSPRQYVTLSVSDTGIGMTPDVIAKAFDPFFTTKPLGQGTGLGLSMIYGFARQSGGQARIYSEPGKGTVVSLYLPRHLGEEEAAEAAKPGTDAAPQRTGATVLVVDDEPTVRMLITDVLEDLGYQTIEAKDGPAGLKVLESAARVDLLITDVGLPGLNGRQVADAGRALRAGLKVLFITGYAENAVVDHGHLEAGMHVLTKPFAMEQLGARVRELIA